MANLGADAYAQCPSCGFDFGLRIAIENRTIRGVVPEPKTLVHQCDGVLRAAITCPHCGSPDEKEVRLYNGTNVRAYVLGDAYLGGGNGVPVDGWIRGRGFCEATRCEPCFAVKVFLKDGMLRSVAVDPHQLDAAEDLH